MIYTIKSNILTVSASEFGAELQSIKRNDSEHEYLWQGDPKYWSGRAYNMFPICGRLTDGKYTFNGRTYEMSYHGFAKDSLFELTGLGDDYLEFTLNSNDEIKSIYPFDFSFTVRYSLSESNLSITYSVDNKDDNLLPFSTGFHPGFNIPIDENKEFEDYRIEFKGESSPRRILFSDDGFFIDKYSEYQLENGNSIRLKHNLFDNDAIFLQGAPKSLTIKCDNSDKTISVTYPDMEYVGFWHTNGSPDAPFVCVEPWNGMPAYKNKIDDITKKIGIKLLDPGEKYTTSITITI